MIGIIALIALAFLAIGGCGGGGGRECNIVMSDIVNGPNAEEADSFWDCVNSIEESFQLSLFTDGGAIRSDTVINRWLGGCRDIEFITVLDDPAGSLSNVEGSVESGILTFDEQFPLEEKTSAECNIVFID